MSQTPTAQKAVSEEAPCMVSVASPMKLVELVYLLLPAYFANMAPPFVKFWQDWSRPISRRWFGEHKTVVGFVLGVLAGIVTSYVQSRIPWRPRGIDPSVWLLLGFAQGLGAMGGDAAKSFLKRRVGIAPGHSWIPADQLDFVIGALLLTWPWLRLMPTDIALILAFTVAAHIGVNHVAFKLGIRDSKW